METAYVTLGISHSGGQTIRCCLNRSYIALCVGQICTDCIGCLTDLADRLVRVLWGRRPVCSYRTFFDESVSKAELATRWDIISSEPNGIASVSIQHPICDCDRVRQGFFSAVWYKVGYIAYWANIIVISIPLGNITVLLEDHSSASYTIIPHGDTKCDRVASFESFQRVVKQVAAIVRKVAKALEDKPIFRRCNTTGQVSITRLDVAYRSTDFLSRVLDFCNSVAVVFNLGVSRAQATAKLSSLPLKL